MKCSSLLFLAGVVISTQTLLNGIAIAYAETNATQEQSGRKVLYWYDPMVPEKQFDKAGKSPFMDMDLVPKYADEIDSINDVAAGEKPIISINAENMQKMGVRTEKVSKSVFGRAVRATGITMENERSRQEIFSQVEGRVTSLKASAVGDVVKKGEVFYSLYSPELLALQNDYIVALSGGMKDMAVAARKRLKLLGVSEIALNTIAKTRKPYDEVPFFIPADGVLSKLEIRNGRYIKAGDAIAIVQDLSKVWVEAAVAETDLPAIKHGNNASINFAGNPTPYNAKVDYIYPTITPETRTGKVRLVVENKDSLLKPAGYATVNFAAVSASSIEKITVPSEAILRSSVGEHVIVALDGGKFQSRIIKTGASSAGKTEIIEGLNEGETVVTSAQFLIDSESNLRESVKKIAGEKQ